MAARGGTSTPPLRTICTGAQNWGAGLWKGATRHTRRSQPAPRLYDGVVKSQTEFSLRWRRAGLSGQTPPAAAAAAVVVLLRQCRCLPLCSSVDAASVVAGSQSCSPMSSSHGVHPTTTTTTTTTVPIARTARAPPPPPLSLPNSVNLEHSIRRPRFWRSKLVVVHYACILPGVRRRSR